MSLFDDVCALLDERARSIVANASATLDDGEAAVRTRWPNAPAIGDAFAAYVAERLAKQDQLATAITRLRIEDLFLAWWAGRGEESGIVAFESAFAPDIEKLVARFHRLSAAELRQRLRIKLFVDGKIADYNGVGFLQNWLRVTAARSFVDAARSDVSGRMESELDEKELIGVAADPRLAHLKDQLGASVKRAFAAAVAALQPRQRTFLRHAYVDRLTLDQIAETYAVHRATVARTLSSAREQLIAQTRGAVAKELGVASDDLASVVGALDTNLELSLSRVLKTS